MRNILLYIQDVLRVGREPRAPVERLGMTTPVQQVPRLLQLLPRCAEGDLADGSQMFDDALGLDGR